MIHHKENHFNMMRKKISQVAIKWFIKKGYHGTSMSTIAKECGIHKSSLYHYFQSKEDLVLMVAETQAQAIKTIFTTRGDSKNRGLLNMFFDGLYDYLDIHYSKHILMVLLAVEFLDSKSEKKCNAIRNYFNEWVEFIKKFSLFANKTNINIVSNKMLALFTSQCFLKFIGISDDRLTIINSWKNVFNSFALQNNQIVSGFALGRIKSGSQTHASKQTYFNKKEKHFLKVLIAEANSRCIAKKTGLTRRSVEYILNNLSQKLAKMTAI
jgi:hypothetical protein